jgi:hypothetical protein
MYKSSKLYQVLIIIVIIYNLICLAYSLGLAKTTTKNKTENKEDIVIIRSCLKKISLFFEKNDYLEFYSKREQTTTKSKFNQKFDCSKVKPFSQKWFSHCLNKCCTNHDGMYHISIFYR